MARTRAELPAGSRITDYISLGVIANFFPAEKVHEILQQTNRASVRKRDLPAQVVVYYVIALALYMRSSYRKVLRCLLEGVQWLLNPSAKVKVAGKSRHFASPKPAWGRAAEETLCRGGGPHCRAAQQECLVSTVALGQPGWQHVWIVADTAENEKTFGRPGASRGCRSFPKIRFVALLENRTHVMWGAAWMHTPRMN